MQRKVKDMHENFLREVRTIVNKYLKNKSIIENEAY